MVVILGAFVLLYIAFNLIRPGGSEFIRVLNANIVILLSIATVILAISVWGELGNSREWFLWYGLTLGWGMWAIAETYWGILSLLQADIPYPSWADGLWLLGYLPMYAVLIARLRSLPRFVYHPQRQMVWLLAIMIFIIWITIAILVPNLQGSRAESPIVQFLNIAYPLSNLILIILVLRLLIIYQGGRYESAWLWIALGFLLFAIGDLNFSYAVTAGLYYPNGQANLLSTLGAEVPYNLSYLAWCVGLIAFRSIQRSYQPPVTQRHLTPVPNAHFLIFTKGDDTVIEVSDNFFRFFPVIAIAGKRLSDLLGISRQEENSLLQELKTNHILRERQVSIRTPSGRQPAYLSGVRVLNPQGEYAGATFVVRIFADDDLDQVLSQEQKGGLQFVLGATGVEQSEQEAIKHLLAGYYALLLQTFYNHINSQFGMSLLASFLEELQSVANQHRLSLSFPAISIEETTPLSLGEFRSALHQVFDHAKAFMLRLTDENSMNELLRRARAQIDQSVLKNVLYFEMVEER